MPTTYRKFGQSDALIVTARLVAGYGDHRVADSALRSLWVQELVEAFGGYPPHLVIKAIGGVIRKCKFWPTIAEIESEIRSAIEPPARPTFREPVDAPLTPEEVERRTLVVAAIKKAVGYSRMEPAAKPDEPFYGFDSEVSDVSPALRAAILRQE